MSPDAPLPSNHHVLPLIDLMWGVELQEATWVFKIIGRRLSDCVDGCVIKVGENLWERTSNLALLFLSGGTDFLSFYCGFIWVGRWYPWTNLRSHGAARGCERKIKEEHFQPKIKLLFYEIKKKKGRTVLEWRMCARTKIHKRTRSEIFTFFGNELKQKKFFWNIQTFYLRSFADVPGVHQLFITGDVI